MSPTPHPPTLADRTALLSPPTVPARSASTACKAAVRQVDKLAQRAFKAPEANLPVIAQATIASRLCGNAPVLQASALISRASAYYAVGDAELAARDFQLALGAAQGYRHAEQDLASQYARTSNATVRTARWFELEFLSREFHNLGKAAEAADAWELALAAFQRSIELVAQRWQLQPSILWLQQKHTLDKNAPVWQAPKSVPPTRRVVSDWAAELKREGRDEELDGLVSLTPQWTTDAGQLWGPAHVQWVPEQAVRDAAPRCCYGNVSAAPPGWRLAPNAGATSMQWHEPSLWLAEFENVWVQGASGTIYSDTTAYTVGYGAAVPAAGDFAGDAGSGLIGAQNMTVIHEPEVLSFVQTNAGNYYHVLANLMPKVATLRAWMQKNPAVKVLLPIGPKFASELAHMLQLKRNAVIPFNPRTAVVHAVKLFAPYWQPGRVPDAEQSTRAQLPWPPAGILTGVPSPANSTTPSKSHVRAPQHVHSRMALWSMRQQVIPRIASRPHQLNTTYPLWTDAERDAYEQAKDAARPGTKSRRRRRRSKRSANKQQQAQHQDSSEAAPVEPPYNEDTLYQGFWSPHVSRNGTVLAFPPIRTVVYVSRPHQTDHHRVTNRASLIKSLPKFFKSVAKAHGLPAPTVTVQAANSTAWFDDVASRQRQRDAAVLHAGLPLLTHGQHAAHRVGAQQALDAAGLTPEAVAVKLTASQRRAMAKASPQPKSHAEALAIVAALDRASYVLQPEPVIAPDVSVLVLSARQLSMQDTARLMQEADLILGPHGDELAATLFAPPTASVVEFSLNEGAYRELAGIAGACNLDYWVLPPATDGRSAVRQGVMSVGTHNYSMAARARALRDAPLWNVEWDEDGEPQIHAKQYFTPMKVQLPHLHATLRAVVQRRAEFNARAFARAQHSAVATQQWVAATSLWGPSTPADDEL